MTMSRVTPSEADSPQPSSAFRVRQGALGDTMRGVTFRSRWTTGGAAYVLLVMALATAAALNGDIGFYLAAGVAAFPSCLILYSLVYPVVVLVAMAAGGGIDGSGSSWVTVPPYALAFGAAAVANVFLVWLVARAIGRVTGLTRRTVAKH